MPTFDFSRRGLLAAGTALTASAALPRFAWAVQGDTLRYAMARDIAILDPAFYVAGEDVILDCVLPTLTQYVRSGTTETQPYVAETIGYLDDTTLEFTLREGLVWTNGYGPVTAADVKFSFERVIDPEVDSPYAEGWTTLDHVEVIDDRTGRLILKSPDPTMWLKLSAYNGHFHCAQAVADAGGTWTTELPAGCGPYVIADWQPNQRLVLEYNPDFTLFEPDFKRIEVYPIEDEKTSELAFEAGEVDYTRIAVASIPRYREDPPEDGHLYEAPETRYAWIGMNTQHPNLQDIRVRQAIQYAADVDAILEGAYNGVAPRATGMIAPQMVGAREANLIAGRDLDKARELLAEAGVPDGFSTTITVMNTAEFVAAAQILQANLAEVGIQAEVMTYDSAVYWNLGLESEGEDWKDLQITFMRFGGSLNGYDILKWLAPDQVGIWNWERHNDAEMGELLKAAQVELDDEKRGAMFRRIQDIMELSGAYIFLTHGAAASIYRDGLDIAMRPDFVPQLRRFEKV